ncbi:hypothetical protein AAV99_00780 [Aurantiacibacter marinus]|uniref:Deacetylase PdaC domain-containing protein n=1 Tax=Aurantiacibacter marinus TaxID=874156 RepID=A0A0H0XXR4_9SPHN|nr:hypothetical protein AAV99_00780 [Aurantiacibacter marinus]
MRRIILVLAPLLALSGCNVPSGGDEPVPPATPDVPVTDLPVPDASETAKGEATGGARDVSTETDSFLFEYSYPQQAGELPALAAWLDQRMERRRQAIERDAARGRAEARENGFPFNMYSSGTSWEVVADLPGWLSLSAALDSYRGGAHPNYGFDTIVWDKEGDRPLEPVAFFTSAEALDNALGERLCEALNAEREKRRGAPVEAGSTDIFDACIKPDETNLLLGSSNGRTFNRIGIQIAPYLAGPYAEGSYEFTFNMDEDLLAIVRPEYREAFSVRN